MHYTPITSFRRAVQAAHLEHHKQADAPLPPQGVNKWEVLRELSAARTAFGLSDRDLSVLQALVSFHPDAILGADGADLVVHPSNKTICERLNGMPCSTMRRHLAHLVAAGVVLRRDSPNGKRYARRYGGDKVAFGFDLTPLVLRHGEFCEAAEAVRATAQAYARLRETVSLMRRDLAGLAGYGADLRPDLALWDQVSDLAALAARGLRRVLSMDELEALRGRLLAGLEAAREVLDPSETQNMSTNDVISEHHYQNSKEESYDSDSCNENKEGEAVAGISPLAEPTLPRLPLSLILSACPEIQAYAPESIRHWHDLLRIAETLRPMMGIAPSAWAEAKSAMGPEHAAVVLAAILQRTGDIRSPGGYLRSLTAKASDGLFSCAPMIMSLLKHPPQKSSQL